MTSLICRILKEMIQMWNKKRLTDLEKELRLPVCVSHLVMSHSLQPHGLYSTPGSSINGILQARILELVCQSILSRGSLPVPTAIFKMGSQQGHQGTRSMSCGSLDGSGIWRRIDTCICMGESLCCPAETITTLLIGDTPIQNKVLKKLSHFCEWKMLLPNQ